MSTQEARIRAVLPRKAAKRPLGRSVTVSLSEGEYAGWEATARADFPAGILVDLQSGDIGRVIDALGRIIVEHNFPDSDDQIAASLADVDPYEGLLVVAGEVFEAIGKLPPR